MGFSCEKHKCGGTSPDYCPECRTEDRKFRAGDRVVVYMAATRLVLRLSAIQEDGLLFFNSIDNPGHMNHMAHPKQCRRLKPKAKPREFWVNYYKDGKHHVHDNQLDALKFGHSDNPYFKAETILVREVLKK